MLWALIGDHCRVKNKHLLLLKLVAFWGPRPALGRYSEARRTEPGTVGEGGRPWWPGVPVAHLDP